MKQRTVEDTQPWYRQFWPWFIVSIPLITIVWCIFMITMAIQSENAMVNDDYYEKGLAINQELSRDRKAAELGLTASVRVDDNLVRVELSDAPNRNDPFPFLMLNLFHPTLGDRDQRVRLIHQGNGQYRATLPKALENRWYLEVRGPDNDWRLTGEATLSQSQALKLVPATQG